MGLELYLFLRRNLVNVTRNEIKTKCAVIFLIYANVSLKCQLAKKKKETIVFQTSSTSNAVTQARSNIQMRQRIGQRKR